MRERGVKIISIVMSLLMILSVISIPTIKANAEGGVDGFVERCYTVTLGRGSDPEGFADWKDQLLNGKSVGVNIAYGFLFSKEYTAKNTSNKTYVKDLYKLFMDREPDEAGFIDWVGKLNEGTTRLEVFAGFANSQEFYNICENYGITAGSFVVGYDRAQVNNVNLFVERLYQTCLGRRGDRNGQKDWVNKLLKKEITGVECARCFIQSKEYINKNLSDDEYVENLYKALMGRASDAEGKANWLYALANGMTRDEVFAGFANSKEFDDICKKYGIVRGTYTAKDKGTYDPNKQNNNDNNNNNESNDQNNDNNDQNNDQNSDQNNESNNTSDKKTGYRMTKMTLKFRTGSKPYDSASGEEYFTDCQVEEYTYGEASKEFPLTKKLTYVTKKNEIMNITQTEFDLNGYPQKDTIIYYPNGRADSCVNTLKYNDKGVLVELIEYEDDSSVDRIERYDDEGFLKERIIYSYDGTISYRIEYAKDSKGVLVGTQYETRNGVEISYVGETYEYDASGNLIKYRDYYSNGRYKNGRDYTYNSNGDCTKLVFIYQPENEGNGIESSTIYEYEHEYDEHGNKTHLIRYQVKDGNRVLYEDYTYEYEEYTY